MKKLYKIPFQILNVKKPIFSISLKGHQLSILTLTITFLIIWQTGVGSLVDTEPPTFSCPGDLFVQCSDPTPYPSYAAFLAAGGTASDDCGIDDESFSWVSDLSDNNTCPEVIIRTYRIEDLCGNEATCEQTITVNDVNVEAYVYLEGALIDQDGTETYSLPMRTSLNNMKALPGQTYVKIFGNNVYTLPGQPYSGAPWSYSGNEGEYFDSYGDPDPGTANYDPDVVDWVLVSLRDAPDGNPMCMKAALLDKFGHIEFVNGGFDCCDLDLSSSYYMVIEHRNHLIIMSKNPIPIIGCTITYDFRCTDSYAYHEYYHYVGQKEILPGVFAMFAGNGNQAGACTSDTDINADDRTYWESQNGTVGQYRISDYNLNGDCNVNDRTTWEFNMGKFSTVPRNY